MPRNKKPIENEPNVSTKRTKNDLKKNVCNGIGKERKISNGKLSIVICPGCHKEFETRITKKTKDCPTCGNSRRYKAFIQKNKEQSWERNCPKCGKICVYTDYRNRWRADRDNDVCRECGHILFPRIKSPEQIRKYRKTRTANFVKYGWSARYSPIACDIFDEIDRCLGWIGKTGRNSGEHFIGELGYWVDYYEPTLNIVIEYDERHHNSPKNLIMDAKRQQEITDYLGCKFYRIKEGQSWRDVLIEYIAEK